MTRSAPRTPELEHTADRAPRHSIERLGSPGRLTRPWQTVQAQLRRSAMFIATVQSNDRSQPQRGGMDCATQPRAAPMGLGFPDACAAANLGVTTPRNTPEIPLPMGGQTHVPPGT